jgi:hypothetical protein
MGACGKPNAIKLQFWRVYQIYTTHLFMGMVDGAKKRPH